MVPEWYNQTTNKMDNDNFNVASIISITISVALLLLLSLKKDHQSLNSELIDSFYSFYLNE